jgi:CheY-like chemotaxis protein
MPPAGSSAPDCPPPDPEQVLREARAKFVASFPQQVLHIERLLQGPTSDGALSEIVRITHKISGFGGTVGLPTVSARAGELEELLTASQVTSFDRRLAFDLVAALRDAFARDLATPPAWLLERQPGHGRRLRVLVVEDDRDQAQVLVSHLAAAGHQTVLVESGEGVLHAARDAKPDVILLDVELPVVDGYTVCRLLKADRGLSPVPVVFMTTRSHLDDRLAGLTLGADEFLTKPVDVRELLLRIRMLTERTGTRPVDCGRKESGIDDGPQDPHGGG